MEDCVSPFSKYRIFIFLRFFCLACLYALLLNAVLRPCRVLGISGQAEIHEFFEMSKNVTQNYWLSVSIIMTNRAVRAEFVQANVMWQTNIGKQQHYRKGWRGQTVTTPTTIMNDDDDDAADERPTSWFIPDELAALQLADAWKKRPDLVLGHGLW